ncbi:MAG: glycosyltransferase [Acidocella sp.]|nr:glycosyltransferase [Acidocella sp.]
MTRRLGAAGPGNVVVFVDRTEGAAIGGWALDFNNPAESLRLRVIIDNVVVDVLICDLFRDDAQALQVPHHKIGFYYHIPARYHDGMRHKLAFAALDGTELMMLTRNGGAMAQFNFCFLAPRRIEGMVDGLVEGLIQGWAMRVDEANGTRLGGIKVLVTCDSEPVAALTADIYRADVAQALTGDAACGFIYAPPALLRRRRTAFRFFAMPGREELQGSPVEISYPSEGERERIYRLVARTDELFAMAYHLSKELKAILPAERFMLADYARWAAVSHPLALERAKRRYGDGPLGEALVSVICPVFRPEIGAFMAAVDSVRAQSYPFLELILIDDASGDPALSAVMAGFAAADGRIKCLRRTRNGGISAASNDGIKSARGAFVAFFDHDDLLVDDAIEIMMRAQAASNAALLYSDEDKVERSGALTAPHFKPGFNHRLLLEINYICHFVMMEMSLVRAVGKMDRRMDGAQDHDFLLRAVELLRGERILHVPEVLYHWRMSAGSTAAEGARAKPKAALAGVSAVAAHLARMGRPAKVESRRGMTAYRVDWVPDEILWRDACVSIIIPFRDQIEMTTACVAAIRQSVRDVRYEIVLVDNWSMTPEAERFCVAQANMPDTVVLRVEEPFNYSRLNNLAVEAARHEFLLLLNNDVFVSEPGWLRQMLGEFLSDDRVGLVGAKLLYPSGTVQHGGVVMGVGGVADHAFRGIDGDDGGYFMRAALNQEISAVTGACMLVRRRAFDEAGGLDERELSVAFNDIDLCAKLTDLKWKIIFRADMVAEHRESASRGDDYDDAKLMRFMRENEVMRQRYAGRLARDKFYNPHFSREGGVYRELRVLQPDELLIGDLG